jgi:hypothetical protein
MEYYVNDPTNFHKPKEEGELCPSCSQPLKYHWNEFEKRQEYLCESFLCHVNRIYILDHTEKYV